MRTANPAMQAFIKPETYTLAREESRTMTVRGTVTATAILTGLCAVAAVTSYGWVANSASRGMGLGVMMGGALVGAIIALIIYLSPRTAPFCSPVYALAEGVFVGVFSWAVPTMYNKVPEGVVFQAVLLTFGILFALLAAYGAGLVRLGSTATKVVIVATAGVMVFYLATFVLRLTGLMSGPGLAWDTSAMGIGFSIFVVVLASLNLVLDFQFIEAGVANRAPRYMEWYGAFGLLVTLVWLYIEAVRLLSKIQRR